MVGLNLQCLLEFGEKGQRSDKGKGRTKKTQLEFTRTTENFEEWD